MKNKLKNTLEHEVELLGRSISVLAIAGLLVVGGASAALLDSFGNVTGDAGVNASIVIDDQQATSVSGPTVDAEFSQDEVVAGDFVSTSHSLDNRADEAIEVGLNSENQEGVSTSNVLYFQSDPDDVEDPSYDVEVSTSEPLTDDSNYSVHVEGSATRDYATVLYPVSDLSESDTITYKVETFGDHNVGNEGVDEIYLNTEDAQYAIVNGAQVDNDGQVTVDLDEVSYFGEVNPSDYSEVQSIGLGFGDASASYQEGVTADVDVTIDDVVAGDSHVDEVTQRETTLAPTGRITEEFESEQGAFDVDTTTRYGLISTTHFSPYVVPDTYTVSTSVNPVR